MEYIKDRQQLKEISKTLDWKQFYKTVFALVLPMALQNLINVGVTAADVAMLGRVGEKVLSGASLAGQVQFVLTLILFGLSSGITILAAQYWGKKDTNAIEKIMGIGIVFAVSVGMIFTVTTQLFPHEIMRIFTTDTEVIEEAVKYLRIVSFTYIIIAITQIYLYVMRSIERVIIATIVYSISLGVNIGINATLIFGLFGFPQLGIQGAAIGTLVARLVELLIVVFYAMKMNDTVRVRVKNFFRFDKLLIQDYMKYAMPVVINELIWGLGFSMHSVIIGHLGSEAVAANAVVSVIRQFSMVFAFGVSNAAAIYLGKTIGEGKYSETIVYAKKFIKMSVVLGMIAAGVIIVVGPIVNGYMVLSPKSREYLNFMIFAMALYSMNMSISCTTIVGILRAGGDSKVTLIIDTVIMWGVSIPAAAIAAFVFKMGVPVVYMLLITDELLKAPASLIRFYGFKWLNNVTRNS